MFFFAKYENDKHKSFSSAFASEVLKNNGKHVILQHFAEHAENPLVFLCFCIQSSQKQQKTTSEQNKHTTQRTTQRQTLYKQNIRKQNIRKQTLKQGKHISNTKKT